MVGKLCTNPMATQGHVCTDLRGKSEEMWREKKHTEVEAKSTEDDGKAGDIKNDQINIQLQIGEYFFSFF